MLLRMSDELSVRLGFRTPKKLELVEEEALALPAAPLYIDGVALPVGVTFGSLCDSSGDADLGIKLLPPLPQLPAAAATDAV